MSFYLSHRLLGCLTLMSMISQNQSAKILLYPFAHCINSHLLNMEKLAAILLQGHHEVTMIVPRDYSGPFSDADIQDIEFLYFDPPLDHETAMCNFDTLQEYLDTPLSEIIQHFYSSTYKYCDSLLQHDKLFTEIRHRRFDLAIYDVVDQCSKILADYIDIPFIAFYTHGLDSIYPRNPAYLPAMVTSFSDQMSLGQRVLNVLGYLAQEIIKLLTFRMYDNLKNIYKINATISLRDTLNRASLKFVLADYGLDYVGPVQPNIIPLGGAIHSKTKPLPHDIEEFLESSGTSGTILFSFGSLVHYYDPIWREIFAIALSKLPHQVLWKYNGDIPENLGNNTKIVQWLPQAEILKHDSLKVFITHCGYNSAYESAKNGVPVVAIPLFGDQFFQATKLTQRAKMGLKLDIQTLTSEQLYKTILAVDSNPSFKENAAKTAHIINTKPRTQEDEILYWVNYVVELKGAKHLSSQEDNLLWYQYFLLDVIAILFMSVLLLGFMFWYIFAWTFVMAKRLVISCQSLILIALSCHGITYV